MKRRTFVKNTALTAFGITTLGAINWNGESFEGDSETTSDILGPYYRPGSPMRSNLIPAGRTGQIMHVRGTVFKKDGKTPLADVRIESWQCDEHEKYDNVSDDYLYRGTVKTGKDGKYAFKTILPVPYKDGDAYRPAHIHLRISSRNQQDLITQLYFKGDVHIKGDTSANSPQSVNRILEIKKNSSNESVVTFNIIMGETYQLNDAGYKKITGLYQLKNGMAEFIREDDLLLLKMNGQIMEGLQYKGNNSFEGGLGFNKVKFELLTNGGVKADITMWDFGPNDKRYLEVHEGIKVLKYSH
jgi:catechol 1,2-dioxygenase